MALIKRCRNYHISLTSVVVLVLLWATEVKLLSDCSTVERKFNETMSVFTKLLNFLQVHYSQVILDCLSAIQMSRGLLLEEIRQSRASRYSRIRHRLMKTEQKMATIAELASKAVKLKTPDYYKRFRSVSTFPWPMDNVSRPLIGCPAWSRDFSNSSFFMALEYDEENGDKCFTEVLDSGDQSEKCVFTRDCWHRMVSSSFRNTGYTVTHGVLYLMFLRWKNCEVETKYTLDILLHDLCCRVKYEFYDRISKLDWVPTALLKPDLVAEQAAVCTLAGYHGFNSEKFFDYLIARQSDEGCFGEEPYKDGTRRHLLVDQPMADGCSAHFSGLVSTFLALRVREEAKQLHNRCQSDMNNEYQ